MSFTAISLYSGAGGMDVGFSRAGFEVVWANDINEDACKTYEANHKNIIRCGDIDNFSKEIEQHSGVDLVFGGPPCQGFSVAGKMNPSDTRSQHVFRFMDIVEKVQPKAFVLENVKALAVLDKWKPVREKLFRRADELGFEFTQLIVLNAVDFGVPQKRERMFFIGMRNAGGINCFTGIDKFLHRNQQRTPKVGEIIHNLGRAGSVSNNRICNARITLATNPVMRKSPYAGMLFNGAGRPIDPNGYANTLPASMGGNKTPIVDERQIFDGAESWIEQYHTKLMKRYKAKFDYAPAFLRRLTVDEALRIQTFPEHYIFTGKKNSVYCQIGNAVPCNLALAMGSVLRDMLNEYYAYDTKPLKASYASSLKIDVLCATS